MLPLCTVRPVGRRRCALQRANNLRNGGQRHGLRPMDGRQPNRRRAAKRRHPENLPQPHHRRGDGRKRRRRGAGVHPRRHPATADARKPHRPVGLRRRSLPPAGWRQNRKGRPHFGATGATLKKWHAPSCRICNWAGRGKKPNLLTRAYFWCS